MFETHVFLFGPPRIERRGALISVDTRKALALLALLAVDGSSARDHLAALLWPDLDGAAARGALRRTLSALRQALPEGSISAHQAILELHRHELQIDIDAIQSLVVAAKEHGHDLSDPCPECVSRIAAAVDAYRGPFLAGFSLKDAPEFDDWQVQAAEGFRSDMAAILPGLINALLARNQLSDAERRARDFIRLDPLDEHAHRLLMRIHTEAGDRRAAIRQFEECARVLRQELDVEPDEDTVRLYERIKSSGSSGGKTRSVARRDGEQDGHALPLIGRALELESGRSALERARTGPQGVAITGEAGIGKTRLLAELARYARDRGLRVFATRCYDGESDLAYAPVISLLRTALNADGSLDHDPPQPADLLQVSQLLPEVSEVPPPAPRELTESQQAVARTQLLDSVSRVMLTGSDVAPIVITVDDVQWADSASLAVLTYMGRRMDGHCAALILAFRDDDTATAETVARCFSSLRRSGALTQIRLGRLNSDLVAASLSPVMTAAGGKPTPRLEAAVAAIEGLPLLLAEWMEAIPNDPAGDFGAKRLMHERLARLQPGETELLGQAAVLGRSFSLDLLLKTSVTDEMQTISILESLLAKRILQELGGGEEGRYDFSHDLLRRLAYEEAGFARRRVLHQRAAEAYRTMLDETGDEASAGQIAHHLQSAGATTEAALFHRRAADHFRRLHAPKEARLHLEAALTLGHPEQRWIHESIGDLMVLTGSYAEAAAAYRSALAGSDSSDAAGLRSKLGTALDRWGEYGGAEAEFRAAAAMLDEEDVPGLSRMRAGWSMAALHGGDADRALELAEQARKLAVSGGSALDSAVAMIVLGIIRLDRREVEIAQPLFEEALELAREEGDLGIQLAAQHNLSILRTADMDDSAVATVKSALAMSVQLGYRHREAALLNMLADLHHRLGNEAESMRCLRESVFIYAEIGVDEGGLRPEVWKLVAW